MKKKAFTLVELLAVIAILGILLAIAIPRISDAVDLSKKKSFEISAKSIVKELKSLYIKENSTISESGKSYVITDNAFVGDDINVKGELPDNGTLYIDEEGKTALKIAKDNLCAVKDFYDEDIFVSDNPALCILNVPEPVPDTCFTYTSTATEVTITDYDNACSKNVIIPDTLEGLPVRIIGNSAFAYNSLLSVSIPKSVTVLLDQAFYYNQLKRIYIPESITDMGFRAFGRNILENITIPSKIKTIKELVFAYNNLESLVIPDAVETISFGSFGSNPLKNIYIGSGLNTFQYTFGKSDYYNKNAFTFIDNVDITISPLNTTFIAYNGGIYTKDMKKLVFGTPSVSQSIPSSVEIIGKYAFANMNTSTLVIPNTIVEIEPMAFSYNQLTSVTIGNSVQRIGFGAFQDNLLTNVILPNSLKSIEWWAFQNNMLTNVTIPSSVTNIGPSTFNNNQLPDNQAFIYKRNLDGSKDTTKIVSYGGAKKNNVIIPSGVTTIGPTSFQSNELISVTIPNTVTLIEYDAFSYNQLTEVTIGSGVITIHNRAFGGNLLSSIVIPNSVTNIASEAFYNNNITNVTIPSNVTIQTSSISTTFYTTYVTTNARAAGTYTAPSQSGTWTKQ